MGGMDRTEFRTALAELDDEAAEALITAIQQRVRALSSRHLAIQDRIDDTESTRQDLERRLQEAEAAIIEQADASVEADVESIEDIESLPEDVSVAFDPELLDEVETIRQQSRSNYQRTAEEGADLRSELSANSDELQLHQEVLAAIERDEMDLPAARDRLLTFFEEAGDEASDSATDEGAP
jgi:hypothetical protein